MNVRRIVSGVAGVLGVTALTNAILSVHSGTLPRPLPGTEHTYSWRGIEVAYIELGDADDPTVLLLHGINAAGTSHEFEPIADSLSDQYHVIAPDLPGFGRSDRPALAYDAELYTDFVREFANEVTPGGICLASSLSGSYAAQVQRDTGVFSKVVLICPTATTTGVRRPFVRRILRSPLLGTALFNLITSKAAIRHFSANHSYYNPDAIDPERVDYEWHTAHQRGARFAPASFVSGYLDSDIDLGSVLDQCSIPITLVWGRDTDVTPLPYGRDLAETADAKLIVFDRARLLPHVEHSERFIAELKTELPTSQ